MNTHVDYLCTQTHKSAAGVPCRDWRTHAVRGCQTRRRVVADAANEQPENGCSAVAVDSLDRVEMDGRADAPRQERECRLPWLSQTTTPLRIHHRSVSLLSLPVSPPPSPP